MNEINMSRWFKMDRITSYTSDEVEISGKTKTNRLQITNGASDGYVLTSNQEGEASWQSPTATSGYWLSQNDGLISDFADEGYFLGSSPGSVIMGGTMNSNIIDDGNNSMILGGLGSNTVTSGNSSSIISSFGSEIINETYSSIIGGSSNKINRTPNTGMNSTGEAILGSDNSEIKDSFTSTIIGSNSCLIDSSSSSTIMGGYENVLDTSYFSSIVGGFNNKLVGANWSVILGGSYITGTTNETVYVPNLNIGTIGNGTPIFNLGLDADGFVVTGLSGGTSGNAFETIDYYQISNIADTRPVHTDTYINLGWDETGNDLELTMLTAPSSGGIYCLTTKAGSGSGSQQTYVTQINQVNDVFTTGIGAGFRGNITIQAQDDVDYPFYQIEIYNPSETNTKIGVCVKTIQNGTNGLQGPAGPAGPEGPEGQIGPAGPAGGILTVEDNLILDDTTSGTTSQAIYGINVITAATSSDLATKLPVATTGKQTVFINNSTMPILVFPSAGGGEINGVVDGYATIPNDGKTYTFYCIENPLPGAWAWSSVALGQIELATIEISHTGGTVTTTYGVGNPGAQLINPSGVNWFNNVYGTYGGSGVITLSPSPEHWATSNLTPKRTLVRTKVYSNIVDADNTTGFPFNVVQLNRYVSYMSSSNQIHNYSASGVQMYGSETVSIGLLNSPVQIGDSGTKYTIKEANTNHIPPADTDSIGVGDFSNHYFTFSIRIPADYATKVYKFNIFLEHT